MDSYKTALVTTLIFFLLPLSTLASDHTPIVGEEWVQRDGFVLVNVNWCLVATKQLTDDKRRECFTGSPPKNSSVVQVRTGMPMTIRVSHFNFIDYSLKLDVKEKVIESYQTLDKAIGNLLDVRKWLTAAVAAATPPPYDYEWKAWLQYLDISKKFMETNNAVFKGSSYFTEPQIGIDIARQFQAMSVSEIAMPATTVKELKFRASGVSAELQATKNAFDKKINELGTKVDELPEKYAEAVAQHAKIVQALASLVEKSAASIIGKDFNIPPKDAGIYVTATLSIQQTDQGGATTTAPENFSLSYLSENKYGLIFFGGYAWSGLKDVKFKQVSAVAGASDQFEKIRDEKAQDFVVFLGKHIFNFDSAGDFSLLASLGTDVKDAGNRYYLGATLAHSSRFSITAGMATAIVTNGEDKSTVKNDIFATIKENRKWAPFAAFTIRLY